ncbi:hypothetical protein [Rhizobium sp. Nf11,1]|uniref:hypothetical protein n=1 Tax=Rhizobium sp. Nf11,1 TaxID=3404923 RepID=UPI003D350396
MLSAEAMRLAAIEILRPTAAVEAGSGFPTLAGLMVLDTRDIAIEELNQTATYTPVLALYTMGSDAVLRGEMAAAGDTVATAVLEIVAELAIDAGSGPADALVANDPEARLVLAALCAQTRYLLEYSQAGLLWRKIVKRVIRFEEETFAAPQLGVRWQRTTMRYHVELTDDDFDMTGGGLPQPIRRLYEALPDQSYAKAKLAALASHFPAEVLPPFEGGDAYGPET